MRVIKCADLKELHKALDNTSVSMAIRYAVIGKVAIEGRWQARDRSASIEYMASQPEPYWLFIG